MRFGGLFRWWRGLASDTVVLLAVGTKVFSGEATEIVASLAQAGFMDKIVALRPLPNGFELQAPPSLQVLREQAELRALKKRLLVIRGKREAAL